MDSSCLLRLHRSASTSFTPNCHGADHGMKFITDFGDSAVLLPLSLAILVWLSFARSVRTGVWWGVALIVCGAGIGILKMLFFACPPDGDLESPSGHTALSALVYGGLAAILATDLQSKWLRRIIGAAAFLFVLAIGYSRLVLHMHTLAEIVTGMAIGTAVLAIFVYHYRRIPHRQGRILPLLLATAITVAALHGHRVIPEGRLHILSLLLNLRAFCR
jgi:membrane-associated phospholipid phosphatase